ncbi:M91 family zinc metallopeptidase [Nocardia sp. GCM10030253]|uniref:M91 family zinc metallopeptidase n=1 Tax=Nocardia sp. GCM10030253 TaxID=3273404 RepID=UPI0036369344
MATLAEVQQWRPSALADAGHAIATANTDFQTHTDQVRTDIQSAQGHWDGAAYWAAYNRIGEDHTEATKLAREVVELAAAMTTGAATLTSHRDVLLGRVADAQEANLSVGDDWVVTQDGDQDADLIAAHQGLINSARTELDTAAGEVARAITAARDAVQAQGGRVGDDTAVFGSVPHIIRTGESITIETGDENDVVTVDQDPQTHIVTVNVNGEPQQLTDAESKNIIIKTQGGDDQISVSEGTQVGLKLDGGSGNDTIFGGKNRDYIDGGTGDDLINSGDGDDVVYGGAGDDTLIGYGGNDYIDGGTGNDKIAGGQGTDQLSGGQGDDFIEGNEGDDKIYAGSGKDTVTGSGLNTAANGSGNDTIYAQDEDVINRYGDQPAVVNVALQNIPDQITVTGSPEFQDRVAADLETLRSSPTGQQMLASLGETGHTLTLTEGDGGRNMAIPEQQNSSVYYDERTGQAGPGSSSTIKYDPRATDFGPEYAQHAWGQEPPVVSLYHEMAHAEDFGHGTVRGGYYTGSDPIDGTGLSLPNYERVAVGLPIDHDNNPATPEHLAPEHSTALTENALRDELGVPRREHYDYE